MGERLDGFNRRGFGEIVDGFIDLQLLQRGLLGGKRFAGRLVGAIGGEPDAVADGEDVVVGWNEVDGAFSAAVEAVLLVVADADHDAQQAAVIMLLVAQRAENGAGIVLVDLGDAVFDVIRCRYAVHFQLGFGAVHLFAKRAENDIAGGGIGSARERRQGTRRIDHEIQRTAPEGRLNLAQRFSAGQSAAETQVPQGRSRSLAHAEALRHQNQA